MAKGGGNVVTTIGTHLSSSVKQTLFKGLPIREETILTSPLSICGSNTTVATSGAGSAHPSKAPEITPIFLVEFVLLSL